MKDKMDTTKLFPTEVIASILNDLPEGKNNLPTELRKLHPIFYEMRNSCKNIMKDFSFDKRGTFVYSASVDQAFSNLETSRIISRTNPSLDTYQITPKLQDYHKSRIEHKLDETLIKEIKIASQELSKIAFTK